MSKQTEFKIYFANTSWMVFGRLFKALIAFIVGIFVARYLGPDRYGVLNYAIGVSSLFVVFTSMGLNRVLTLDFVRKSYSDEALLGSSLFLRNIGALISLLSVILFLIISKSDLETTLLTIICSISFFARPFENLRFLFEAKVWAKNIAIVEAIQCILSSLLRIYFILVKEDVLWFAVSWLSEWIFVSLGYVYVYRKKINKHWIFDYNKDAIFHLLRQGFPLLLSGIAIVVYQQIDKIMIRDMLIFDGDEQLGFYSVAARIMPFVFLIPQMLSKALVPALLNSESNQDKYKKRLQLYLDIMTWTGISLSMILITISKPLIWFYGQEFSSSVILLQIMALKGVFFTMSLSSGLWIISQGLNKWALLRNLAGAITNIILNLFMIPLYGALGASYATVISLIISSFLVHPLVPSLRPIFYLQFKSLTHGLINLVRYFTRQYKLNS